MKLHQLTEAPIGDFGTIGDFDQEGSIKHAADRRAVTAQPVVKRIKKAWEKTPFDFNLYFVNIPGMEKYVEHGKASIHTVKREFPELVDRIQAGIDQDAINIVYTNNEGTDRVSFTPWIIAHRLSHALVLPNNTADARQGFQNPAFNEANEMVFSLYRTWVSEASSIYQTDVRYIDAEKSMQMFFEHIGTMKSARSGLLNRPTEFGHEVFAQYLLTGQVQFNPIDEAFLAKFGELVVADPQTDENAQESVGYVNRKLQKTSEVLPQAFGKGLEAAKGKIIFM